MPDPFGELTPPAAHEIAVDQSTAVLPAEPRPIWRMRDFGLFVVFGLFSYLLVQFSAFALYAVLGPLFGWKISTHNLATDAFFAIGVQFVWYVILLAFIYLLVNLYYGL